MVIVVFLSDVKTGKDMIIATVRPKDKISVVMKKVEGKLGMKQAQMDWWTIAEKDRIRAKKAKDPKSLLLEKKMDPKMTFGDYGIDSDTCVYAKKKGAPPNDPTASPFSWWWGETCLRRLCTLSDTRMPTKQ
ncbi:hypothetical protein DIPPA_05724 [Diplonema papillatum]|nr:hypothetical protein DIPPA_05728 [Diplonema papillatum]KAJ9453883.1 hypothetical protein DIPPA_05724 [Diplonema papillatum]